MKSTLKFNKGFIPATILSSLIIISGIVGYFVKGINFGIDFKPGVIEEVRVAPPVAYLTYEGTANASLDLSSTKMDIIISGIGAENKTATFDFVKYPNVQTLADAVNAIEGVKMVSKNGTFDTTKLFLNSAASNKITQKSLFIYPAGTSDITTDDVRNALTNLQGVEVKQLGVGADASYQIRLGLKGDEDQNTVINAINKELIAYFDKGSDVENVAVIKTDFIGSSSSKANTFKTIIVFFFTILIIWAYAAIRFHWDFALGSIVALIHDTLIMFTFLIWTQIEFSTTVFAAVLTIVGYSINATVVILDRVRYNLVFMPEAKKFTEIMNKSLSDTFVRSVLTTVTTLFAVIALFVYTTGDIKNFALLMIVGLICGMYSSIFISSAFICACRKNWKPEFGVHHSMKYLEKENKSE